MSGSQRGFLVAGLTMVATLGGTHVLAQQTPQLVSLSAFSNAGGALFVMTVPSRGVVVAGVPVVFLALRRRR